MTSDPLKHTPPSCGVFFIFKVCDKDPALMLARHFGNIKND